MISSALIIAATSTTTAMFSTLPKQHQLQFIVSDTDEDDADNHDQHHQQYEQYQRPRRRQVLQDFGKGITMIATSMGSGNVLPAFAVEEDDSTTTTTNDDVLVSPSTSPVELIPLSRDAKKIFNEGRALESQGNMMAAQRLYNKVTKISPRFVYGWSNLGNTQVALGDLSQADTNYSQAITLCRESSGQADTEGFGIKKCNDLYLLLLNRGSVRLNAIDSQNYKQTALRDLREANTLRNRPDPIVAQNLARAEELNGLYPLADKNYNLAISMSSNEVNPFWLRSAMVKFQLQNVQGGKDLLLRVENRFPDAPEVKAASAAYLWIMGSRTSTGTGSAAALLSNNDNTNDDDTTIQQQQDSSIPSALALAYATKTSTSTSTANNNKKTPQDYQIEAQRKFLEIPNKQRLKFSNLQYLQENIAWPPFMIENVLQLAKKVNDV